MDDHGGTRAAQALWGGRTINRRTVLRLLGAGAAVSTFSALMSACGGEGAPGGGANPQGTRKALANTPVVSGTPMSTFSTPVAETPQPGQANTEARKGGILRLASSIDPDALDPAGTIQLAADAINDSLYDRLVYIGRDRLPHPWVAEKWDISPDGKEITFSIREGMTFHDGTDLDGAAVKFSFDRILDPEMASPAKAQMGTLQQVELVDDYTVRFLFSAPYAPFFTNISLGYGGIVSPAAVEKRGDEFGHNPVGSGPFKLKEWSAGQRIVLERFAEYQNYRADGPNTEPAYVDEIEFKIISEASTRLAALESGELHVSDVDFNQIPSIEDNPDYQIVVWKEATNHNFLEYANKEPFTDVAVRRAIAHMIDRESIIQSAWNGYATPNYLPMPVGVAGWDATLGEEQGYQYDPDQAKQILADAGYSPGPDGVLQKDGQPLSFTLLVYSGSDPARVASEIITEGLNSIGMKVEIQIMEFGAELPLLKEGKHQVDWMRWTWPDPVILSLLFKTPGWTNQTSDPELDALLEAADTELDPGKRTEKVHQAIRYILDQAIIATIATDWIVRAARSTVQGYDWDATGYPRYVNVWLSEE